MRDRTGETCSYFRSSLGADRMLPQAASEHGNFKGQNFCARVGFAFFQIANRYMKRVRQWYTMEISNFARSSSSSDRRQEGGGYVLGGTMSCTGLISLYAYSTFSLLYLGVFQ